jgi:predicted nucleic acid-binding protein
MKLVLRYRTEIGAISYALLSEFESLVATLQTWSRAGDALTAANAGAVNSGDATTDAVIANLRTRVGELEALLQSKGLLS